MSAVTVVSDRRPLAWVPVLGHLCRDLMNGAPRHFNLPIAPRVDYDKLVSRLESELGEPLGEAPAPLTPEAWAALRALLTEHQGLTERLAPEQLFAAAGRPATGSETARRELDRAWRETQRFFLSITHIRDPSQTDPDPAEVISRFGVLEDLLAAQLRAVPYWSLDEELQEIAALEHPTPADLQRAARLWRGDAEMAVLRDACVGGLGAFAGGGRVPGRAASAGAGRRWSALAVLACVPLPGAGRRGRAG